MVYYTSSAIFMHWEPGGLAKYTDIEAPWITALVITRMLLTVNSRHITGHCHFAFRDELPRMSVCIIPMHNRREDLEHTG
jgi:hypothetical protein